MKEVYILSATRTPIGSFNGALASISATKLGAHAIKNAVAQAGIQPNQVNEVYMGCVLQANVGQAPATQAATFAGLTDITPSTTVNKVCASGMKAIMLAAQSIMLGTNDIVVAGGMESMSQTPYYLDKARNGFRYGNGQITDGIVKDGLFDVYKEYLMGNAAELCATTHNISRAEQDAHAIASYERAQNAYKNGKFKTEISPIEVPVRGKDPMVISEDEEYKNVKLDKVPASKPAFIKDGTVTAANASKLSDGAAALVLISKEKCEALGLKPIGRIVSFADAQQAPEWFTTAPSKALPLALQHAGLSVTDMDYFEINEAFSVVSLANNKLMNLNPDKVNINGGAVALGHPLGMSGARIMVTLLHTLLNENARYGAAGICNGGGGASAMVIERM
ncbi:MAG TPA: acetyl-CoA C-acyltransferase [Bacteroidia bacterium]|nr:acetyl-CoA C-acyltransferase [Bacteroidia bacterium]